MTHPADRAIGHPGELELRSALAQVRPRWRRAILFTHVATLLLLAPSVYMLEVYDRVVNSRNLNTLLMLTLAVVFAYLVMQVLEWVHEQEMHAAGLALDGMLSRRVFDASLKPGPRGLPGSGAQALADLRTLREFLGSPVLKALLELPVSAVFLVVLFAIHALLGWAALLGAAVQLVIALLNDRATRARLAEAQRQSHTAQLFADAALRNAQVIAAMGLLGDIRRRWHARQRQFLQQQAEASRASAVYSAASKLVQLGWGSMLLGLAGWLLLRGELAGGAGLLIVASILGGQMLRPLGVAVAQWRSVVLARGAWQRLATLLGSVPVVEPNMPLPPPVGRLEAQALVVAPPGASQPVLRHVSLALQPGEVLAVVGPSAAGKSCLARALVGLWPSSGGKARLDGVDLHTWDKAELGPHIGYLPQEVELLDGSIADNIARFGPIDRPRLEAAAQEVGLHDFIASLPGDYDWDVGSDGNRLSGGQRQRIGLARALYGNPVFVVLDEPNASLDDAGDAALVRAISGAKARGTTFVVITHRVSVLGVADKMLWLDNGEVQTFGPRDQVLAAMQKITESQRAKPAAPAAPEAFA